MTTPSTGAGAIATHRSVHIARTNTEVGGAQHNSCERCRPNQQGAAGKRVHQCNVVLDVDCCYRHTCRRFVEPLLEQFHSLGTITSSGWHVSACVTVLHRADEQRLAAGPYIKGMELEARRAATRFDRRHGAPTVEHHDDAVTDAETRRLPCVVRLCLHDVKRRMGSPRAVERQVSLAPPQHAPISGALGHSAQAQLTQWRRTYKLRRERRLVSGQDVACSLHVQFQLLNARVVLVPHGPRVQECDLQRGDVRRVRGVGCFATQRAPRVPAVRPMPPTPRACCRQATSKLPRQRRRHCQPSLACWLECQTKCGPCHLHLSQACGLC